MTEIMTNEILGDHMTLGVGCSDRIYRSGSMPGLQMPGQSVKFLHHCGYEISWPSILGKMADAYKAAVEAPAEEKGIPLFHRVPRKVM
jgi:hypothetical protein